MLGSFPRAGHTGQRLQPRRPTRPGRSAVLSRTYPLCPLILAVYDADPAGDHARHYSIPLPDPIAAIEYHMQRLGLTRKDLEPLIGSRARVSEVLNRKHPLTIRMIRNLHAGLGISAQALLQEYPLVEPKAAHYPTQRTPAHQIAERKLDQGE